MCVDWPLFMETNRSSLQCLISSVASGNSRGLKRDTASSCQRGHHVGNGIRQEWPLGQYCHTLFGKLVLGDKFYCRDKEIFMLAVELC